MKLYSEHRVNPFASCLPLILQLPVFISLYAAIKGLGPLSAPAYQASVEALNQAPFLWIPHLGAPDPTYVLLILYVVTQMISTELMVATQSDQTQKWIMRAMPIMFVLFLFRFPAGLFVYWVTTNVWTIGQQLVIRRTMPKPEQLAAQAKAKPKKRSRFMEVMMASQTEAMKQREQKMNKGEGGGASKQGSVAAGKKPAPGGKKPPPGKAKRKQVAGGKPGQPAGTRPKGTGTQQGKPRPAGQQPKKARPADKPAGGTPAQGGDGGATTSAGGPADE
jgi:YidC/Oxa1 family membrane protein insertase